MFIETDNEIILKNKRIKKLKKSFRQCRNKTNKKYKLSNKTSNRIVNTKKKN